ncbi:hypothetical protein [Rhodococcus qingshengii]|uniref:hypothetical protein n=1 Tax=Rhodococcus qingshengii TaxID=334542 RepID=UPI0035D7DFEC
MPRRNSHKNPRVMDVLDLDTAGTVTFLISPHGAREFKSMTDDPEQNLGQEKPEPTNEQESLEDLDYIKDMEDLPKDDAVYVRMPRRYRQRIRYAAQALEMNEAKFLRIALTATANEVLRRSANQEIPDLQENSVTETKAEENP